MPIENGDTFSPQNKAENTTREQLAIQGKGKEM